MELNLIKRLPSEFRQIYRKNYNSIHTRVFRGRIKNVYHFMIINDLNDSTVKKFLGEVVDDQSGDFKLNIALGFILRHIETGELRFFHTSQNSMLLDTPTLIDHKRDTSAVLEKLNMTYLTAHVYSQRPSTKWLVAKIICIRFDTFKVTPTV